MPITVKNANLNISTTAASRTTQVYHARQYHSSTGVRWCIKVTRNVFSLFCLVEKTGGTSSSCVTCTSPAARHALCLRPPFCAITGNFFLFVFCEGHRERATGQGRGLATTTCTSWPACYITKGATYTRVTTLPRLVTTAIALY